MSKRSKKGKHNKQSTQEQVNTLEKAIKLLDSLSTNKSKAAEEILEEYYNVDVKGESSKKPETLKLCDVNRFDYSQVAQTLLDILCDIARITGDSTFSEDVVYSILSHIINLYYVNSRNELKTSYISEYTMINGEEFSPLFNNPDKNYYKKDYQLYQFFREAYSLAVITEIMQSDFLDIGVKEIEGVLYNTLTLKFHVLLRRVTYIARQGVNKEERERYLFGSDLVKLGKYLNCLVEVTKIDNFNFTMQYDKYTLELPNHLLAYIALNDKFTTDKYRILEPIIQYISDNILGGEA